MLKRDKKPIGSYARHYYDLYQLARTAEVPEMLQSAEYTEIKADTTASARRILPEIIFRPRTSGLPIAMRSFPMTSWDQY